ncbi:MAG: hypothetical protein WCT48_05670, partial [Candidatus Paceibacterota bacterium]
MILLETTAMAMANGMPHNAQTAKNSLVLADVISSVVIPISAIKYLVRRTGLDLILFILLLV